MIDLSCLTKTFMCFFFSQRYFKNRQFMELCQLDEVANG